MLSILSEHYLILSSLIILCFGIIYKFATHLQFPEINASINVLALLALLSTAIIVYVDSSVHLVLYNSLFVKDHVTLLVEAVTILLAIGILIMTSEYNKREKLPQFEYVILLLFVITSIHLLVTVEELFAFYLILEFQSICLYVLSSLKKNKYSVEAAMKYFIIGSFASILLLLGFSFIYGISGMTNLEDLYVFFIGIKQQEQMDILVCISILLISAGLFFKIYMAPMHLWVSDIYAQSPTSSVIIFATTSLLPFYIIVFKFYVHVFGEYDWIWKTILLITCLTSILIGTIGAMYQYSIKRLLAYSSIANTGYIFASLLVYQSPFFIANGLLYILLYTINSFGLFSLIVNMRYRNEKGEEFQLENIDQLKGLVQQNAMLSVIFAIYFYTIAGLPPFSFFFTKIFLFSSLLYSTQTMWIVVLMAIVTVISVFYYLRIIQIMFFSEGKQNLGRIRMQPQAVCIINVMIVIFNGVFMVYGTPFVTVAQYISFCLYI